MGAKGVGSTHLGMVKTVTAVITDAEVTIYLQETRRILG